MTSPFLKLFGKSPFLPLYEHMVTAYECVKELIPFFEAVLTENWPSAQVHQEKIDALEHKADEYKRELRLSLPKDMFLPVARGDLLDLISHQDHVANSAEDIAGLVLGRRMTLPTSIQADYKIYLYRCVDATKQAFKAIRELNDLYEAGFGGKEAEIIQEMIHELHVIEDETDTMQMHLRHQLFAIENELPPIHVIFLYQLIGMTGSLADESQKIGDRLQICIAR